jgi:hypothetical protein
MNMAQTRETKKCRLCSYICFTDSKCTRSHFLYGRPEFKERNLAIFTDVVNGASYRTTARKFGLSQSWVYEIVLKFGALNT